MPRRRFPPVALVPALLAGLAGGPLLAGCMATQPGAGVATQAGADWSTDAAAHRGEAGRRVAYDCPPNPGRNGVGTVWGAEVYTDDSAVCAAAVHAGKITFDRGGRVVIETRPGQDSYRGTDWNGVVSQPYGAWGGSFVFVAP